MPKDRDEQQVGYRRPPRETRFRPGQSGNPSGKKRGLRTLAAELQDILNEQITFAENGAVKTMSRQKALASSLVSAAIAGDLRATAIVMSHVSRESPKTHDADTDDDFEAVQAHRERRAKQR